MELIKLIQENTIRVPLIANDRQEAIGELVDVLGAVGAISDSETIRQMVW